MSNRHQTFNMPKTELLKIPLPLPNLRQLHLSSSSGHMFQNLLWLFIYILYLVQQQMLMILPSKYIFDLTMYLSPWYWNGHFISFTAVVFASLQYSLSSSHRDCVKLASSHATPLTKTLKYCPSPFKEEARSLTWPTRP